MKVFIVYAHPEQKSFNGALKNLAVSELTSMGHEVIVSDLYAMKFKAVADSDDFLELQEPDFLKYQAEQRNAVQKNAFSEDIKEEQRKLLWSDFVIFQFPLWWYSVPAILKGWFDRVFASGLVYGKGIGRYDTGGLKGRKAMLSITTGTIKEACTKYGLDGDIFENILYHINHGMLYFSGLQPVEPFIAWAASHSEKDRLKYMEEYSTRLRNLLVMPEISYHPQSHYDQGHELMKEFRG